MPDAHLEQAIREELEIPDGTPMLPEDMTKLHGLLTKGDIESLKGLEHAKNLRFLHVGKGQISDLTPLSGLLNLHTLKLEVTRL